MVACSHPSSLIYIVMEEESDFYKQASQASEAGQAHIVVELGQQCSKNSICPIGYSTVCISCFSIPYLSQQHLRLYRRRVARDLLCALQKSN